MSRQLDPKVLRELMSASDDELESLLGVYATPLLSDPSSTLRTGRSAEFWRVSAVMGDEGSRGSFVHAGFKERAQEFFSRWGRELRRGLCGDSNLHNYVAERGLKEIDLAVAAVVGAIAASIPALAPFSGLLTIVGVMVVKSGLDAFCQMLEELGTPQ